MDIVTKATHISFYPKDDNVGLSRNMLLQINVLSEEHEYILRMADDCTYYTWTFEKVSSNSEIRQIIDTIREICKGIEVEFKITNTYPHGGYGKQISLEEIYAQ